MNYLILAFSGTINSGKTTISQEIADKLNWKKTSFGDYVRFIAKQKGIEQSRENLQQIGEQQIKNNLENFCKNILSFVNWQKDENLIIDGIRHKEVLDNLKKLTNPSVIYLIYIDLDFDNRKKRSQNLGFELKKHDSHSTEQQVLTTIPNLADLIVDGNKKIEKIVSEILEWLNSKQIF